MKSTCRVIIVTLCVSGASAIGVGAYAQQRPSVSSSDTMRAQPVANGEVVSIRAVTIRPGQTRVGTVTGAALGAIAGSQLGGGRASNTAGGIGGAVVGGSLGSAAQGARTTQGVEISVALQNGQTVAIIQPGDVRDFRVGDQVRVVGTADNARVTR